VWKTDPDVATFEFVGITTVDEDESLCELLLRHGLQQAAQRVGVDAAEGTVRHLRAFDGQQRIALEREWEVINDGTVLSLIFVVFL
jgi:hypothetical protein